MIDSTYQSRKDALEKALEYHYSDGDYLPPVGQLLSTAAQFDRYLMTGDYDLIETKSDTRTAEVIPFGGSSGSGSALPLQVHRPLGGGAFSATHAGGETEPELALNGAEVTP